MLKRVFDVLVSCIALLLFAPIIVGVALVVLAGMGCPVFFSQERPGLNGKIFRLYKFRTMTMEQGRNDEPLPDELRLTTPGRVLRSASLDELPALWNVLKGDMSLVGPRPLLVEYLDLYSPEQMRRHEVRPGITGWAQVNGRNLLSWPEKLALDVWYVDNRSFVLDLRVLAMTVVRVVGRHGVNQDGHATVEPFRGEQK